MTKQIRTRVATTKEGETALKKAHEFLFAAQSELVAERWNSAGLNAIHSGISAADARLIRDAGMRSAAQDHSVVVNLLEQNTRGFKGSPRTQILGLLKMKNIVAYDQRLITESESRRLVNAAERFLAWATS